MRVLLFVFALLVAIFPASGQEGAQTDALVDAIAALDEGVPQVAIVKLRRDLATPSKLSPAERKLGKAKLAEAFLAAGRIDDALRQIQDPELDEPMLEARIDAASGKWRDALAIYETLPALGPDTALAKAECLWQLGRPSEAVAVLERVTGNVQSGSRIPAVSSKEQKGDASATLQLRLGELYLEQDQLNICKNLLRAIDPHTPGEQKWKQYVEARLWLAEGRPDYALGRFKSLQEDLHASTENLLAGSVLGRTEAANELTGLTDAGTILERFIWRYKSNPRLDLAFRKLDEIYSCQETPNEATLQSWSKQAAPEDAMRAGFAQYYLAKNSERNGKNDAALQALENFEGRFPNHPILPDALLLRGKLFIGRSFTQARRDLDAATQAARSDPMRAEIEMASAAASFEEGKYEVAAAEFRNVARRNPSLRERALYNSALSWLHEGNYSRFTHDYEELSELCPGSALRPELLLEEGLIEARQSQPKAEKTLRQFVRDFPDNPRVPEARLALAELCFANSDAPGAGHYLHAVNAAPAPVQTMEQSDYLAIFVADTPPGRDENKVIALCKAFIERSPESAHLPDVRMKLGQVYFRREEFNNAQTQFEILAGETSGPLAEKALFLAGQASVKSLSPGGLDRAIVLFGKVVKLDGPLKLYARLQLAAIQNKQGKAEDAKLLYDDILRAGPPVEVKLAALAGKALNLSEMGAKDPAFYEQALAVYDELAGSAGSDVTWHNQALYQKGRCLEVLKRPDEALAAYYDVLQSGAGKPQEYFWFYKAGFEAGHLCESQEQWKSAIGIYQKMSALEGPRAQEASDRMRQLRMEHFVWE